MRKKEKILFLHPNFPGQFKHLASIAAENHYDVRFICLTDYSNKIKNINRIKIKGQRGEDALNKVCTTEVEKVLFRAESYRRVFKKFKSEGWNPDFVIGHSGWGCGIFIKNIWPQTKFLAYMEWWFSDNKSLMESLNISKNQTLSESHDAKLWTRNIYTGFELSLADEVIAPTEWQKSHLPNILQERCLVIRDGIDLKDFQNCCETKNKTPLVTYGSRGMEPVRHFREFIKAIPHLLKLTPDLEIEIIGEDKIFYGGNQPSKNSTWGIWAKNYLDWANVGHKVKWLGRLEYKEYKKWLRRSWCHVYFSRDFVCSWSLLEALASNIPIVANNSQPVLEYCKQASGVYLVNQDDIPSIAQAVAKAIEARRLDQSQDLSISRRDLLQPLTVERAMRQWEGVTGLDLNTLC